MSKNKFKQTEIGEIPDDWDIETLAKLTKVVTDGSHWSPREHTNVSDYRIATVKDMQENGFNLDSCKRISESDFFKLLKQNCVPKERDVLIAKDGSYLKHVFVFKDDQKIALLSSIAIIRTDENKLIPEYLKYYLKTNSIAKRVKENYVSGAVIPRIILKDFEKIQIGKPSVYEQQQIASILSSLDDKIELNRKMNKTLEEIGMALFKRWFVDFEFPNENGEPYKSSGGEMVESELGEMPKGWQIKSLDQIAEYLNGVACQKYPPLNDIDSLPVIKIAELKGGFSENSNRASSKVDEKYHIKSGDVLFSWSGSLEVCLWPYGEGILNQHLFKVSSEYYPKWFYYFWTLEHLSHFRIIAASKATTMGHIQRKHLSDALTVVPTEDILIRLSPIIDKILEKIIVNNKEIMNLSNVRDSILPRLMSGKIRV